MKSNDTTWLAHLAALAPTAAILALVVGGCSVLPPAPPPDNIYLLEAATAPVSARPALSTRRDIVLAVGLPRARAGYDTARMVWVRQSHGLETYARNRWADTPARMLEPLIKQALDRSGVFHAVVQSPSGVAAKLRLDTEIIRLQQDFSVKPSEVRFTLGAQLIDTSTQRVIATAEFDETEKCETEDAYGGVRAANRALERLMEKMTAFVAGNLHSRQPHPQHHLQRHPSQDGCRFCLRSGRVKRGMSIYFGLLFYNCFSLMFAPENISAGSIISG